MALTCAVMVHPLSQGVLTDNEKRHAGRKRCLVEATSYPLEDGDANAWGGTVKDVSGGGLKLALCFPFGPGTYLTVDLQRRDGASSRSLVCRVVHVHDHADGTWTLGCEFLKPLSENELELLL